MSSTSLSTIAYYLSLIGGILMVIFGLISFLSSFGENIFRWGFPYSGIVTLIMGVVAIIGSRSVNTLVWAIVLIVVGAVGGSPGGILVVLGGIFGLLTALTKK